MVLPRPLSVYVSPLPSTPLPCPPARHFLHIIVAACSRQSSVIGLIRAPFPFPPSPFLQQLTTKHPPPPLALGTSRSLSVILALVPFPVLSLDEMINDEKCCKRFKMIQEQSQHRNQQRRRSRNEFANTLPRLPFHFQLASSPASASPPSTRFQLS